MANFHLIAHSSILSLKLSQVLFVHGNRYHWLSAGICRGWRLDQGATLLIPKGDLLLNRWRVRCVRLGRTSSCTITLVEIEFRGVHMARGGLVALKKILRVGYRIFALTMRYSSSHIPEKSVFFTCKIQECCSICLIASSDIRLKCALYKIRSATSVCFERSQIRCWCRGVNS